jgi:hypothetical protein
MTVRRIDGDDHTVEDQLTMAEGATDTADLGEVDRDVVAVRIGDGDPAGVVGDQRPDAVPARFERPALAAAVRFGRNSTTCVRLSLRTERSSLRTRAAIRNNACIAA